jgi:ceroid-lipofuscinosis MFS transporter 7
MEPEIEEKEREEEETTAKLNLRSLVPLVLVGLVDAISFMVVSPSLVFYVLQLGGTKEQYGLVLSVFSFASFTFKPILGYWSDRSGETFRLPFLGSLALSCLGGFLYFLASAWTGRAAIYMVVLGRFLSGVGAANSALGFAYMALMVPPEAMTQASAALSMTRVLGMAAAPSLNVFLQNVHGHVGHLQINPLNSVGLMLVILNLLSFGMIYWLLEDPPEHVKQRDSTIIKVDDNDDAKENNRNFWKAVWSLEILTPILTILGLNANFQLLETGLAPATSHALRWGPVEVSTLFGVNAVLIFLVILLTFQLSAAGVSDQSLLVTGLLVSIVGYSLMYFLWTATASMFSFILPVVLSTVAFPFLGAPSRSLFTKVVAASEQLRRHQGTMQAVLSMAASVAGFAAPGLIAAFVLRTPDQVEASRDHRELSPWALFAPAVSTVTLVCVLYLECYPTEREQVVEPEEDKIPCETDSLLAPMGQYVPTRFHPRTEAHRRHSVTIMGIPQFHPSIKPPRRKTIAVI